MKHTNSSDSNHSMNGVAFSPNDSLGTSPPVQNASQLPPEHLTTPLLSDLNRGSANSSTSFCRKKVTPHSGRSLKDIFQSRKRNLTLDELHKDDGYHVYMVIFNKILWLLMFLGLWAPKGNGWKLWCLRYLYPIFIYIMILYPWTTFLTQEAYWSVPVFLFIVLHVSGIFAYRSARKYWQRHNHLVQFVTSTFIPFYDDFTEFERQHRAPSSPDSPQEDQQQTHDHRGGTPTKSLRTGFEQRRRMESRERSRKAMRYGHIQRRRGTNSKSMKRDHDDEISSGFDLQKSLQDLRRVTSDPFRQREEDISWSTMAGSENKLSLSLFYEATRRLWKRFWITTLLTTIPIVAILLVEIWIPGLHSTISMHSSIKNRIFIYWFIPINCVINFIRIVYVLCEFIFMAFYFQFICECHRGDLLIHLHYYDVSDIWNSVNLAHSGKEQIMEYLQKLELRLASIVWDWDRIAASIKASSRAFRWWILVMVTTNIVAGVTAILNLTTRSLNEFPQHLEMHLPAMVNLALSFFVLLIGTKVSHMNTLVNRRCYLLLASTHFAHVEVPVEQLEYLGGANRTGRCMEELNECDGIPKTGSLNSNVMLNMEMNGNHHEMMDDNDMGMEQGESMELLMRKQNLYIQAQAVARCANTRKAGISVYGLVLNRNLFLAFFSPFVAFFLFCINTWLPTDDK